jgi:type VI secretion system protein VasJ
MELLSLGRKPISPDQPTGSDVRYEPEFEELQFEIDKLSSPSAAGGIDWKKVEKLSSEILANKSKDLLVASYLAVAQIHTSQLQGLAVGLRIYLDLLDEFWDDLYPPKKRMRGRMGAIEWWLEKTEATLKQLEPASLSPKELTHIKEYLEQIEKLLKEYLEEPPSVRPIQRFIDAIASLSDEKVKPEAPPEKPPERAPEKPQPEAPSIHAEEITSEEDAQRVLRSGLQKVRQAAVYLTEQDLANSGIYRWARMAAWSAVESLPPATDGRTRIDSPAPQVQTMFKDLREKGNWEAFLKLAERTLSQFIFWLDLNRFAAEALASLGSRYEDAHDAVCRETAFLIHRLPGLEDLSFSDGTPFADAETKQWLRSSGFGARTLMAEAVPTAESTPTTQDENHMAEVIHKAQALAKQQELVEAVKSLQQELRNSFSQKERLLWRLALTEILVSSKQPKLALPHLEEILQDIRRYRLEEWDPDLTLKVLKMVWVGFDAHSDQEFKSKASDTLNRIAKLDPAEAIRLAKR